MMAWYMGFLLVMVMVIDFEEGHPSITGNRDINYWAGRFFIGPPLKEFKYGKPRLRKF